MFQQSITILPDHHRLCLRINFLVERQQNSEVWWMLNLSIRKKFNFRAHTLPQARQWCRRLVNVNGISHCIHIRVSESGLHTGATFPSWVIGRLMLVHIGGPTYDGGDVGIAKLAAALSITRSSSTGWCPDDTSSELGCAAKIHYTIYGWQEIEI